jgi:tetratricopeptide (TPR) repeat protein
VVAAAVADGRYLRLKPQEPERTLLAIVQARTTVENSQELARLLEQHPNYLAALQEQGRMRNDLRDFQGALAYLQRALALYPESARTLCEIGRAYFGLQNLPEARKHLEKALTINPWYEPGWQYLLRFLALTRDADGRRWAERAREIHPRNFNLALAGARLYQGREAIELLHRLLGTYAPSFTADERPAAATAFSQAIQDLAAPWLGTAEALELVRRGCEIFPQSARLADLLGHALHLAGKQDESYQHHVRALDLRRTAAVYHGEFPKEDGRLHAGVHEPGAGGGPVGRGGPGHRYLWFGGDALCHPNRRAPFCEREGT